MTEENTTKSFASMSAQTVEKEASDRSAANLKLVTSSPQFMALKEILQENQKLLKNVDNERERKNAGYKVLEEMLSKGNSKLGI